jgi:hypothetical protein
MPNATCTFFIPHISIIPEIAFLASEVLYGLTDSNIFEQWNPDNVNVLLSVYSYTGMRILDFMVTEFQIF